MPIYNTDVNCSLTAASQSVNGFIYNYVCGHDDSSAEVDLEEGDRLARLRVDIISELNEPLGTHYDIDYMSGSTPHTDSVVITDCPRADYGICVLTANPSNSLFSLDTYSPTQGVKSYMLTGSCFANSDFDPLAPVDHPDFHDDYIENFGDCDDPQTINVDLRGNVMETMKRIEELRYADMQGSSDWWSSLVNIFAIFAVLSANWFGIDLRSLLEEEEDVNTAQSETIELTPVDGGDGNTVVGPERVGVEEEVIKEEEIEEPPVEQAQVEEQKPAKRVNSEYNMAADGEILCYTAPYLCD